MNQKEDFSQIEAQDPMRQAFDKLFGPLLNGESIFIEIHSRGSNPNVGTLFIKLLIWGKENGLAVVHSDLALTGGKDGKEVHKEFLGELKIIKKAARTSPVLFLTRRFYELKEDNYPAYINAFTSLVSQKHPVGIIIETQAVSRFIRRMELTELGKVQPYEVDIEKVISPRNSSYIPRQ